MPTSICECVHVLALTVCVACTGSDRNQTNGLYSGGGGGDDGNDDGSGDATGGGDDGGDDGVRFDLGNGGDLSGPGGDGVAGCDKVDFLFVVDNSGSMGDEQAALIASFPGFISTIQDTLMASDYHIMAIDTDEGAMGTGLNCDFAGNCTCGGMDCCEQNCGLNIFGIVVTTCNGYDCNMLPPPGAPADMCDTTLGAGRVRGMTDCGIVGGNRYMVDGQPDLGGTFNCVATVGTAGDGNERPMAAMQHAITTQSATGGCNEGFLRDDAILVVTFITDESETGSGGTPALWKQTLIDAKHGDEAAIVVLGLLGDPDVPGGVCTAGGGGLGDGAEASPNLRTFAESFQFGRWGSICSPDYAPFFADAVSVIDVACDEFVPPG